MLKKAIFTVIAALGLAVASSSFVAVSAQTLETATIMPDCPDATSCTTDMLSWPAQSVPGLTGYQVDFYGSQYGIPYLAGTTEVGPDQTTLTFGTCGSVDIETNGINYYEISTVISGTVSSEPFAISGTFAITSPPFPFYFNDASVGDATANVSFGQSGNPNWTTATVTASPGDEAGTLSGGFNSATDSSLLTGAFTGLTNGVAYTFTLAVSNSCGTYTTTSPLLEPADLVIVPPEQNLAPLGQPYSGRFGVGGFTNEATIELDDDIYLPAPLPSGLSSFSFASGTVGILSGTPTTTGLFSFQVCGYAAETIGGGFFNFNGSGGIGCIPFTLTVGDAPSITSACPTTASVGGTYSCTITTTGFPAPSLTESGALPTGLTFTDNGNGTATLSGTPDVGTGGTYTVGVTASNGFSPNASQSFTLTVDEPPSFTTFSPPLTATARTTYSYTFAASGFPAPTFTLGGGAPSWLSINSATGTVSGTVPTHPRSFTYSVTATNTVGSVTAGPFTVALRHGKGHHYGENL